MESLGFLTRPRQTTPDYLTGCTDAYERTNAPGIDLRTVPKSSEELSTAYYSSELWRSEHEQLLEYKAQLSQETGKLEKNQPAAREGQQQRVASSTYTINFYWQTWCLIKRQFLRKWGNRVSLIVDNVTSIVLGLVIGSLFYDLPSTSDGAFTRGGVMFIALFQNAFGAFGELGMPVCAAESCIRSLLTREDGWQTDHKQAQDFCFSSACCIVGSTAICRLAIRVLQDYGVLYNRLFYGRAARGCE